MPDSAALYFYVGTFAILIAAGMGLPVPEEIPIAAAGAAVGHSSENTDAPQQMQLPPELLTAFSAAPASPFPAPLPWGLVLSSHLQPVTIDLPPPSPLPSSLRWWIMLPVCIVGAIGADVLLYGVGRWGGQRLLQSPWVSHLLKPEKRETIEGNFHKYGALACAFGRFLPAIRSPIFIMAGVMRLPFPKFLLADGLAGVCSVSVLFTLAFWFGDSFRALVASFEGRVKSARPLLILLGITAVGIYLFYHFLRHPVATGDPGQELPLVGEQVAAKMERPPFIDEPPQAEVRSQKEER
ncbi:MAG: DedA family protein [Planctomycetes bacterium]|nr:DedA family protein [Planctomycetota bacterium]